MKVLFVLPEFAPQTGGGICTYYNDLLKLNQSWEAVVIQGSAYDVRDGQTIFNNIPVHYLKKVTFDKYQKLFNHFSIFPEMQKHLASAWAMYEQARELTQSFDVVVCTDWGLGFVPWIIKQDIPVLVHLHGSIGQIDFYEQRPGVEFWSKLYLTIESNLFAYADKLITHSIQNINFWNTRIDLIDKFALIPPIITAKAAHAYSSNPVSRKFTGIVVGRIQGWKGVLQLCEALTLLKSAENVRIFWIGRNTFYHAANCWMDDFLTKTYPSIWKKVIVPMGEMSHDSINEFYEKSDFAIVPSTWDMFNLTAIEHLMHMKPLICSSGAGVSELLQDCTSIEIFDNTSKGLAKSIEKVVNMGQEQLNDMGKKGYDHINNISTPQAILMKHQDLIQKVIEEFNGSKNLLEKFDWLMPAVKTSTEDSREMLTNNWPVKDIGSIFLKRLRKKLFIK